jgi:hypothetical protein
MKRTLTLLPLTPPLASFYWAWLASARSTAEHEGANGKVELEPGQQRFDVFSQRKNLRIGHDADGQGVKATDHGALEFCVGLFQAFHHPSRNTIRGKTEGVKSIDEVRRILGVNRAIKQFAWEFILSHRANEVSHFRTHLGHGLPGLSVACAMKANHCSGKGSAIAERPLDTAQEDQTTRRFTLAGYRRRKTAVTNPLGKLQSVPQIATGAVVEQNQPDLICREMGPQAA